MAAVGLSPKKIWKVLIHELDLSEQFRIYYNPSRRSRGYSRGTLLFCVLNDEIFSPTSVRNLISTGEKDRVKFVITLSQSYKSHNHFSSFFCLSCIITKLFVWKSNRYWHSIVTFRRSFALKKVNIGRLIGRVAVILVAFMSLTGLKHKR